MTVTAAVRNRVSARAGCACEFCGTSETDAGGDLSVDQYRAVCRGGCDDADNLLYCCIQCNQFKGDYWPDGPDARPLWNPRADAFADHFVEMADGSLGPLTPAGAFTVLRLRLNRPALVARRIRDRRHAERERLLLRYREASDVLRLLLAQQGAVIEEQHAILEEQQDLLRDLLGPD